MRSSETENKSLKAIVADSSSEELQTYLRGFVQELTAEITSAAPDRSEEVLSALIMELALSVADARRRQERRKRQAEGIAAAQARGVHFGRPSPPLPDDFEVYHRAWRNGEMTLRQAANACGMRKSTFENAVRRKERFSDCRTSP